MSPRIKTDNEATELAAKLDNIFDLNRQELQELNKKLDDSWNATIVQYRKTHQQTQIEYRKRKIKLAGGKVEDSEDDF